MSDVELSRRTVLRTRIVLLLAAVTIAALTTPAQAGTERVRCDDAGDCILNEIVNLSCGFGTDRKYDLKMKIDLTVLTPFESAQYWNRYMQVEHNSRLKTDAGFIAEDNKWHKIRPTFWGLGDTGSVSAWVHFPYNVPWGDRYIFVYWTGCQGGSPF